MQVADALSRASLSEQIRDRLLARIMEGTLKPGDRLVELKIAAEMETSQAPVREAIRELEAIGIVESMRNKGSRVRVIGDDELKDMYDVRAQLEGYAAELAARRKAAIADDLRACIEDMKKAARKKDSAAFAEHNSTFHRMIVDAAGNVILADLWETLNVKVRTFVNVTRSQLDLNEIALSHADIADAIASGSASKARKAAEQHVLGNKPS